MVNVHESPGHFSVAANFSDDDFHHLLGTMIEHHHQPASEQQPHQPPRQLPQRQQQKAQGKQECADNASVASSASAAVSGIDEETKALARSERKRSREKQRRLDVNKQFTDLTKLIGELEKEERKDDPTVFRQTFSATNRADLICRTIAHLERLRDSNKRKIAECASLETQLQEAQKAGEEMAEKYKGLLANNSHNMMMPQPNKQVMMMVPMMMPADGSQAMSQYAMQAQMNAAMNPFMMPQQFMMPPAQAQPPVATQQQQQPSQPQQQQPQQQQQQSQMPQQSQGTPQQHTPQQQHNVVQFPSMQAQPQMMFSNLQGFLPNFNSMAAGANGAAVPSQHHQGQQANAMSMFHSAFGSDTAAQPATQQSSTPAPAQSDAGPAASGNNGEQASNSGTNNGSNYAHCA